MKVNLKYGIKTYSGTLDGMTYGSYRKDTVCLGRKYVKPSLTNHNVQMKAKMKNLSAIYAEVNSDYKVELKQYASKYAAKVPEGSLPPNAYALWIKMMFSFASNSEGHIELSTVTYNDLQTVGTDILSISTAVENGYLDSVPGANELRANM